MSDPKDVFTELADAVCSIDRQHYLRQQISEAHLELPLSKLDNAKKELDRIRAVVREREEQVALMEKKIRGYQESAA